MGAIVMNAPTLSVMLAFTFILSVSVAAAAGSFSIGLHYDNGVVAPGAVQLLEREPPDFFHEPEEGYAARIIAFNGSELYSRGFDFGLWAYDNPEVLVVADVQLILPSFNNMNELHITDNEGRLIAAVDLSEYAVCNQNKVCNADYGETAATCPEDCIKAETQPAEETLPEQAKEKTVAEEKPAALKKDYILIGALIAVFVIIIALVLAVRKKQAQE